MIVKPTLQGPGTVLNQALVDRLAERAKRDAAAREAIRRRNERDHAVVRTRIPDANDAK